MDIRLVQVILGCQRHSFADAREAAIAVETAAPAWAPPGPDRARARQTATAGRRWARRSTPGAAGVPIQRADRQRPAYSGKVLAQRIVPELEAAAEPALAHDSSTNALIRRYLALRDGASQEKTG